MPPVRARPIPAEPLDEGLCRARAHRGFEDLPVIQPRLKVIGRGLNHHGRFESVRPHSLDGIGGKVVDEAQTVHACRPDINMRALAVLVAQPFDCLLDLDGALPFSENHVAGFATDAKIKALATHRAQLDSHQPLHAHGCFLAPLITLLLGHRAPPNLRPPPERHAQGAIDVATNRKYRLLPLVLPAAPVEATANANLAARMPLARPLQLNPPAAPFAVPRFDP